MILNEKPKNVMTTKSETTRKRAAVKRGAGTKRAGAVLPVVFNPGRISADEANLRIAEAAGSPVLDALVCLLDDMAAEKYAIAAVPGVANEERVHAAGGAYALTELRQVVENLTRGED